MTCDVSCFCCADDDCTGVEKPDGLSSKDGERVGVVALGVPRKPLPFVENENAFSDEGDGEEEDRNPSTLDAEYDRLMLPVGR